MWCCKRMERRRCTLHDHDINTLFELTGDLEKSSKTVEMLRIHQWAPWIPTCQKPKWLLSPGPGPETYQCGCYPHAHSSFKSLYSSLSHSLFHYPLHCSRPQKCLLCYPLHPDSQDLFAFTWTDPDNHHPNSWHGQSSPKAFVLALISLAKL